MRERFRCDIPSDPRQQQQPGRAIAPVFYAANIDASGQSTSRRDGKHIDMCH
jgi:hypothetical protein